MVYGEIVPDCCENHTEKINTLCRHNAEFVVLNWRYLYSFPESNEFKQRMLLQFYKIRTIIFTLTYFKKILVRFRYAQTGTAHVSDLSCS